MMLPSSLRNQIFATTPLSELQRWSLDPSASQLFSVNNCREILRQRYQLSRDQLVRYYDWLVEPISLDGQVGFTSLRDNINGVVLLTPMQAVIKVAAYCGEVTIDSDFFLPDGVYALLLLRSYLACRSLPVNGNPKAARAKEILSLLRPYYYPETLPQDLFYLKLLWQQLTFDSYQMNTVIDILLREAVAADATEVVAMLLPLIKYAEHLFDLKPSHEMALLLSTGEDTDYYKGYYDQLSGLDVQARGDSYTYQIGRWYAGARDQAILEQNGVSEYFYWHFLQQLDLRSLEALYQMMQIMPELSSTRSPNLPAVITRQMFADIPQLREFVLLHMPDPDSKLLILRRYAILLNEPVILYAPNEHDPDIMSAYVVGHHQFAEMRSRDSQYFDNIKNYTISVSDIIYSPTSLARNLTLFNFFRLGQQLTVFDNAEATASNLLFAGELTVIPSSLDSMIVNSIENNEENYREISKISLRKAIALSQQMRDLAAPVYRPNLTVYNFNAWRQLFPQVSEEEIMFSLLKSDNIDQYNEDFKRQIILRFTRLQELNRKLLQKVGQLLTLAS